MLLFVIDRTKISEKVYLSTLLRYFNKTLTKIGYVVH